MKKIKRIGSVGVLALIVSLLALFYSSCTGSNEKASARMLQAERLLWSMPDSSLLLMEPIPSPEKLKGKQQADYCLLLTHVRLRCNLPITSDSLINIAIDYYSPTSDADKKVASMLCKSSWLLDIGKEVEAARLLKEAEEQIDRVDDSRLVSLLYGDLAYINKEAGDYHTAMRYYDQSLAICEKEGYTDWTVNNLLSMTSIALHDKESQDYLDVYSRKLLEKVALVKPDLQRKVYHNLGSYYLQQDNLVQAESYIKESMKIYPDSIFYKSYMNLAEVYDKMGYVDRADSLWQVALKSPDVGVRANVYQSLYGRALRRKAYEEAARQMKLYVEAVESFYNSKHFKDIMEVQAKYDKEVLAREHAEMQNYLYIAFLLFVFLAAIAWWGFVQARRKFQRERQDKVMKLQIQIHEVSCLKEEIRSLEIQLQEREGMTEQEKNKLENEVVALQQQIKEKDARINQMKVVYNIKEAEMSISGSDIQSLNLFLRLSKDLSSYTPAVDRAALLHWVDITHHRFASRLLVAYPNLSSSDQDLCCFTRMGYSHEKIAEALGNQPTSINRSIYRTCTRLRLKQEKNVFEEFIARF